VSVDTQCPETFQHGSQCLDSQPYLSTLVLPKQGQAGSQQRVFDSVLHHWVPVPVPEYTYYPPVLEAYLVLDALAHPSVWGDCSPVLEPTPLYWLYITGAWGPAGQQPQGDE
jgi:hypothetical protein